MDERIEKIDELTSVIYEANHKKSVLDYRWIATEVYNAGYRKQSEGVWIVTENGCVINCSECGYRLELCYPDGTEVRALPCCPNCGAKMEVKNDG